MGDLSIPAHITDVTPAWLTAALAERLHGATVTAMTEERIGDGVGLSSALHRVKLTLDDPGAGPESVVVKLRSLDEAAHFTCTAIRMYHREVSFFREVAPTSPFAVPECHLALSVPDSGEVVIVMEDLGGLRAVDQLVGAGRADARVVIECIARLHARWWGREDAIGELEAMMPLDDPLYPMVLPDLFAEGWSKAEEILSIPAAIDGIGATFGQHIEPLMARLGQAPTTFCHGDLRIDNLLFALDGSMTALDFQLGARGVGGYDVGYFTSQSLTVADRRAGEDELLELYRSTAIAAGVPESDLSRLVDDYDHAVLFCLVYPIIALRNVEPEDGRGRELTQTMLDRVASAIGDRDLGRLVA